MNCKDDEKRESKAKKILKQIQEVKTAKKYYTRIKSIISGESRRNRISKEFAAFKKPKEKSPAFRPRRLQTPASKVNKKIEFSETTKNPRTKAGLAKAYAGSLSHSTQLKRKAHWKRTSKMDPKNPRAYTPAPGDKGSKTKLSKHTISYKKRFGESVQLQEKEIAALRKKSEKSGIAYGILKKVYDRGMAAWRTGHRPGTTPQQWAFARVNSYITKGKTYHTTDKDLRESVAENLNESFVIAKAAGYGTIVTAADAGIRIKGGFALHPTVEEEMKEREEEENNVKLSKKDN